MPGSISGNRSNRIRLQFQKRLRRKIKSPINALAFFTGGWLDFERSNQHSRRLGLGRAPAMASVLDVRTRQISDRNRIRMAPAGTPSKDLAELREVCSLDQVGATRAPQLTESHESAWPWRPRQTRYGSSIDAKAPTSVGPHRARRPRRRSGDEAPKAN